MTRIALCALLVAVAHSSLSAQDAHTDSIHHRNDCRLAAQSIAAHHPAPKEGWAMEIIQNCAEGGPVLARALKEAQSSTDTALLNAITRPAIQLRDGDVYTAALDVAGNRGATIQARVFAIRTLMWAMYPGGSLDYDDLADLVQGRTRSCFGAGPSTHTFVTHGETPLPADYVDRAKMLAQRINTDAGEPREVRRAAACLYLLQPWPGLR